MLNYELFCVVVSPDYPITSSRVMLPCPNIPSSVLMGRKRGTITKTQGRALMGRVMPPHKLHYPKARKGRLGNIEHLL